MTEAVRTDRLQYLYPCGNGLREIDLHVNPGEFVGLLRPNGCGKSTLLKNIYRDLKPDQGLLYLDGRKIEDYSYRQSALKMSVLGQENELAYDYTVREMVEMGRYPHSRFGKKEDASALIASAMKKTGIESIAEKSFFQLSGGEKQRVLLTRAIVQDTPMLLLDEPTNHLDIYFQYQVFDLVRSLGRTVLAAIHDLNIASLYCDRIYVLKKGRIVLEGRPEEVITEEMIREVYDMESKVISHPVLKKPYVIFLPSGKEPENEI